MANPFLVTSYAALDRWMTAQPPVVVFDIGANDGGYTGYFLHHGARKVVAFEPLPMYAERIRVRFAGDSRVEVQQIALGECDETKYGLSVLNCWTLAEREKTNLDPAVEFPGQKFDVNFGFIDSGEWGIPDFVKLDADGYEPAILRGAARLLATRRPAILLELSYLPQELGDSCDRMVYDLYVKHRYVFVSEDGKFVCHSHRDALSYFPWNTSHDVLAVPVEHSSLFA